MVTVRPSVCRIASYSSPAVGWLLSLLCLSAQVSWPIPARSAEWTVSTTAELQSRLIQAQDNGEDDVIQLEAGLYQVPSTVTFSSVESHTLSLSGAGIGLTILDGGVPAAVQLLNILSFGEDAAVHLNDMTLRNGRSTDSIGGALHVETATGDITVELCEISDSSVAGTDDATIAGGAALDSVTGDIRVDRSTFLRNSSPGNVGGLFAGTGGTTLVSSCRFESNSVANSTGSEYFGDGGGAMLYAGEDGDDQITRVHGCTFVANSATGGDNPDGGGLMIYQNGDSVEAEVIGNTFDSNTAGLGGAGLFVRINSSGRITCSYNAFVNNTAGAPAGGDGGGAHLFNTVGETTVHGNTFVNNQTTWDGGGLWLSLVDGEASVTGNLFAGNEAGSNGGGMFVFTENATSVSSLSFDVFDSNSAGNVGGGLSFASTAGSLHVRASTFFANSAAADGGGLYIYREGGAPAEITDLILSNDTPSELGFSGPGTTGLTVTYSDVEGGNAAWMGSGCISSAPLFEEPTEGDLRLSWPNYPIADASMSPCIDAGDPLSPNDPDGTPADMGALPYASTFLDGFECGSPYAWTDMSGY